MTTFPPPPPPAAPKCALFDYFGLHLEHDLQFASGFERQQIVVL